MRGIRTGHRAAIFAGTVSAIAVIGGTAAPSALAVSPSQFCAVLGAPATAPDAESPIIGQGCFATRALETSFVQSMAATTSNEVLSGFLSPASPSVHLGVAWSGEGLTGNRYDFYGTNPGTCASGNYYQFANLNGPFDSEANDTLSGANCYDAYWHSGSNFDGRQWDCSTSVLGNGGVTQSCGDRMPSGDDGAGHSVRFRG